jgi:hypothetical protein
MGRFYQQPNLLACAWVGILVGFAHHRAAAAEALSAGPNGGGMAGHFFAAAALAVVSYQCLRTYSMADESSNFHAANYGRMILEALPLNALLLSRGDLITNSASYMQRCEGVRPDVTILDQELMSYEWLRPLHKRIKLAGGPAHRSIIARAATAAGIEPGPGPVLNVTFPAKKFHPFDKDGYSMRRFLDVNMRKFDPPGGGLSSRGGVDQPNRHLLPPGTSTAAGAAIGAAMSEGGGGVFVAGQIKVGDITWADAYRLEPVGLVSRVVRSKTSQAEALPSWEAQSAFAMHVMEGIAAQGASWKRSESIATAAEGGATLAQLQQQKQDALSNLPDYNRYGPETWERVVLHDYHEALHNRGFHLLTAAIAMNDDPKVLSRARASLEQSQRTNPFPPEKVPHIYKNLGAYSMTCRVGCFSLASVWTGLPYTRRSPERRSCTHTTSVSSLPL